MRAKPVERTSPISARLPNPHERVKRQEPIAKWNCKSIEDRNITIPIRDSWGRFGGVGKELGQSVCRRELWGNGEYYNSYTSPWASGCGWCNKEAFQRKVVDIPQGASESLTCFDMMYRDPCSIPEYNHQRQVAVFFKPFPQNGNSNCRGFNNEAGIYNGEVLQAIHAQSNSSDSYNDGPSWDYSKTINVSQWLDERLKLCPEGFSRLNATRPTDVPVLNIPANHTMIVPATEINSVTWTKEHTIASAIIFPVLIIGGIVLVALIIKAVLMQRAEKAEKRTLQIQQPRPHLEFETIHPVITSEVTRPINPIYDDTMVSRQTTVAEKVYDDIVVAKKAKTEEITTV